MPPERTGLLGTQAVSASQHRAPALPVPLPTPTALTLEADRAVTLDKTVVFNPDNNVFLKLCGRREILHLQFELC